MRGIHVFVLLTTLKWITLVYKGWSVEILDIRDKHFTKMYMYIVCDIMMHLTLFFSRTHFHRLFGIVCFENNDDGDNDNSLYLCSLYLVIYLIRCWQSPPLTLVNEMRLLLGPQCLVAMVWVRFISCCLAIPRVSWLFFLRTHTTRCLKYNETGWAKEDGGPQALSIFPHSADAW